MGSSKDVRSRDGRCKFISLLRWLIECWMVSPPVSPYEYTTITHGNRLRTYIPILMNWEYSKKWDVRCCTMSVVTRVWQSSRKSRRNQRTNGDQRHSIRWGGRGAVVKRRSIDVQVELEKLGVRKLRMSAKEVMTIAEKLYSNGWISYPRYEWTWQIHFRPCWLVYARWIWVSFAYVSEDNE